MPGSRLREFGSRLLTLFRRRALDAEFDNEVEMHISLLVERFEQQGMTAEEAHYAARRQFGGISQMKEELRERRGFPLFETLLQDARYISRQLRKSPVFTASAVLTLALGIGANTAIFSLVNQLILRLLPIKNPQQVVELVGRGAYYGGNSGHNVLSYPMYEDLPDHNQVFSRMMCSREEYFTLGISGQTQVVRGELVSGNYFGMLGIHASLGRVFTANDDLRTGESPLVVLSYAYWIAHFGGRRDVVGKTIRINNYPMTIVGVSQPGFDGMEPGLPGEVFVPVTMSPRLFSQQALSRLYDRRERLVNVYGRLKPGITSEQAKAGLQPLFHQILDREVREPAFRNASIYDKQQFLRMWLDVLSGSQGNTILRHQFEKPLWILMGVVGLVLLIACTNLASLLTARSATRQREIAVRLALGSSRFRMIQQLVTESLLLAGAGGIAGIGVAVLVVKGMLTFLPANISGYDLSSAIDWRTLGFSFILSLLTGFAFGLVPALQSVSPNIYTTLKDQSTSVSGGAAQVSLRKLLVAAQVSLSLLLLIGASLFVRSLSNLQSLNPGFQTDNLLQFQLSPASLNYTDAQSRALFHRLEQRLSSLPGVVSAGTAVVALLSQDNWMRGITIAGYTAKPGEDMSPHFNAVSPGYFPALGIHILAGRNFRDSDIGHSTRVAVVSESFARHYFGNEPAVGQHIGEGTDPGTRTYIEIIGVVNNTKYEDLQEQAPRQVFLCAAQAYAGDSTIYVRTEQDSQTAFRSIRRVVHELEPNLPITGMKTLEQQLNESLVTERLVATLSTGFSILATLLAVIGLYGVMSYIVARRAREIAIRMALGALKSSVVWLVMREVLLLVGVGIAIAIPVALALAHLVQAELYGIEPTDLLSILFATLLLAVVALLAGYIPARRAVSYDPISVLRYE